MIKHKKNKNVVIALVNPYQDLRQELKNNNQDGVIEILLKSNMRKKTEWTVFFEAVTIIAEIIAIKEKK